MVFNRHSNNDGVVYTLWILRKSFGEYITNKQIPEELIMRLIENTHTLCTTAQQLLKLIKDTYVFYHW